jgi:hypothetical protein
MRIYETLELTEFVNILKLYEDGASHDTGAS